ncbi:hypothetical protein [Lentzea sp. NPDC004782]|uniref:hypothetical protein n=1 Tax=Lentzea sp. NPDC004782 TaxID=3154458 RepID=UPI0033B79C60
MINMGSVTGECGVLFHPVLPHGAAEGGHLNDETSGRSRRITPSRRICEPIEVANLAVVLASDESPFMITTLWSSRPERKNHDQRSPVAQLEQTVRTAVSAALRVHLDEWPADQPLTEVPDSIYDSLAKLDIVSKLEAELGLRAPRHRRRDC